MASVDKDKAMQVAIANLAAALNKPRFDESVQLDPTRGAEPAERWDEFVYNSIVEKGRPQDTTVLRSQMRAYPEMVKAIQARVQAGVASHPGKDGALVGSGGARADGLVPTSQVCRVIVNPVYRDGVLRGTEVAVHHNNLDLRDARDLEADLTKAGSGFRQSNEPYTTLSYESPTRILREVAQVGKNDTERVYHVEDVTFIDLDGVASPPAPRQTVVPIPPGGWKNTDLPSRRRDIRPLDPAEQARYAEAQQLAKCEATVRLWAQKSEGKPLMDEGPPFFARSAAGAAVLSAKLEMLRGGSDLGNEAASYLIEAVTDAVNQAVAHPSGNAIVVGAMVKNERSEGLEAYHGVVLELDSKGNVSGSRGLSPQDTKSELWNSLGVPDAEPNGERPRVIAKAAN